MLKLLRNLLLVLALLFALWPYVTVFRLNGALAATDPQALAPLIDLAAIQAHYKERLGHTVNAWLPRGGDSDEVIDWLAHNLQHLGDRALDQAITLDWVHTSLREAIQRRQSGSPQSFLSAVDFAFFESWDRFVIRLGAIGANPTHLVLTLEAYRWQVTDIAR
jgi:hypothetical protein